MTLLIFDDLSYFLKNRVMRLLLISNSTMPGEPYLDYPKHEIRNFLGDKKVTALFIPYAAVTFSFDQYVEKVQEKFMEIGHRIVGIHICKDPVAAVHEADAIIVGGGNTWQLVRMLHNFHLITPVRDKVLAGTPYVGWSAGANVACPTLCTTNDMPIIDPLGFNTFHLVPFQINPHYLDVNPEGHAGETREQRIQEFLEINPGVTVVGLREGTMLRRENNVLRIIGSLTARIFKNGKIPAELGESDDLSFLLDS
jgi:dipeptidase E